MYFINQTNNRVFTICYHLPYVSEANLLYILAKYPHSLTNFINANVKVNPLGFE